MYMDDIKLFSKGEKELETLEILWDFKIKTYHLISARQPVLVNKKKEKLPKSRLCCSSWSQDKTARKRRKKYPDLATEQKELWNMNWEL